MLLIAVNLLLWVPAVAGWGGTLFFVHRKLLAGDSYTLRNVEPVWGMAVLASAANLVNFFAPVSRRVSMLTLLAGWLLCWLRLRPVRPRPAALAACLAVPWLIVVAWWVNEPPLHYDAGLYYFQTIKWLNESALPLGLVNLHGRLAFNQSWLSFAALLKLPFVNDQSRVYGFLPSALLLWFYGVAVGRAAWALRAARGRTFGNLFLASSGWLVLSSLMEVNLSSPSADLPVFVFTLWSTQIAIEILERDAEITSEMFALIFLCAFSVTIKLSAAPLLLLPCGLLVRARLKRVRIAWRSLSLSLGVVAAFMVIPWLVRGLMLSGCVAYPAAFTCVRGLRWAVPEPAAREMVDMVKSWSRGPFASPDVTLSSWAWLRPWLDRTRGTTDIIIDAYFLACGLVSWSLSALIRRERSRERFSLRWLIFPLAAALVFWFFTAPDVRFAVGYFWALALCVMIAGLRRLCAAARPGAVGIALRISIVFGAALLSVYGFHKLSLQPLLVYNLRSVWRAPFRRMLLTLPEPPRAPVETRAAPGGELIYVPVRNNQCWSAPLPCALPSPPPDLRVTRAPDGRYLEFDSR